jgi:uncharacterized protein (UPF0305 family)
MIAGHCDHLAMEKTRGDLGSSIAAIVLSYSPKDLHLMKWNFSARIRDYSPEYRKTLEETITAHLHGTYQRLRLLNQQGAFASMQDPVSPLSAGYWKMVASRCATGEFKEDRLRFLKYLLSGFCMFVQIIPGHPVGMPFPGGDKVDLIDGVYYCPVRTKSNDVDAALCPFCPAEQTPEIGYLKPPVRGSKHRKQEFIKKTYDYHHFNG